MRSYSVEWRPYCALTNFLMLWHCAVRFLKESRRLVVSSLRTPWAVSTFDVDEKAASLTMIRLGMEMSALGGVYGTERDSKILIMRPKSC